MNKTSSIADTSNSQTESTPKDHPFFRMEIPGRLPSWNQLLGMEQWQRHQFKKGIAAAFLFALSLAAEDCSTRTTLQKNTMLTYCATLESYLETRREQQKLKSAKKRLAAKNLKPQ